MAISKNNTGNNERFSVVVPVYNRESLVIEALDSIYAQEYRPISLIVVDNNSTDNTLSVVKSWCKTHDSKEFSVTIAEETEPGATSARNRGLQEVSGDVMMFFDSDDIMLPDLVSTVMSHFRRNPELEVICWPLVIREIDGKEHVTRKSGDKLMETHLIHSILSTQAYAFRRKLIERSGVWDPLLYAWNDYEFGVRILMKNPKFEAIDRPLCVVRRQPKSITGESFHARLGVWEMSLDKIEETLRGITDQKSRDSYLRMIDYRRTILGAHYSREGYPESGKKLLSQSLSNPTLGFTGRLAMRLSYFITSHHIRGAWTFFGSFIR